MGNFFGFPITIVQGADYVLPITWVSRYCNECSPIDITGYSAVFTVKQTLSAEDPALALSSTENGLIIIQGITGQMTVTIPNATTSLMTAPLNAVYDLFLTAPNSLVTRLLWGSVYIAERVMQ